MSYAGTDTDRRLANVVMFGRISEIDPARGVARVDFDGAGTDWIPWTTTRAGGDRTYWCPEVGEQVVVAAVGGDLGNAAIIGCLFQDAHPEAADNADTHRTIYKDGAVVEYDRAGHNYLVDIPAGGKITLRCGASTIEISDDGVTVTAPRIDLN